jgi:hypothetical protein
MTTAPRHPKSSITFCLKFETCWSQFQATSYACGLRLAEVFLSLLLRPSGVTPYTSMNCVGPHWSHRWARQWTPFVSRRFCSCRQRRRCWCCSPATPNPHVSEPLSFRFCARQWILFSLRYSVWCCRLSVTESSRPSPGEPRTVPAPAPMSRERGQSRGSCAVPVGRVVHQRRRRARYYTIHC